MIENVIFGIIAPDFVVIELHKTIIGVVIAVDNGNLSLSLNKILPIKQKYNFFTCLGQWN